MNDRFRPIPITTPSPAAVIAIHRFAAELVSHGAGAGAIFDAVAADPDCALAQAYAAALFLTQLTREGHARAAPHIVAAQQGAARCSAREVATIDAVAAWGDGDEASAAALLRGVVEAEPHDLVAAKLCQILELGLGDVSGMLRTSAMAAAAGQRSGYALGLHAFALEQAGHPRLALRFARRAIAADHDRDPWAQHAAAHALLALGQPTDARNFLWEVSHSWARCSSFMQTHNWWHLALLELDLGNPEAALRLFDTRVWGVRKGHCQDQINAISLLLRLEMAGADTCERWDDIASQVAPRAADQVNDFLDLHYLIALARGGRGAVAVQLARRLAVRPVAGSLAAGIVAHAGGDYSEAMAALTAARPGWHTIGGSNVQRSLFEAILQDSRQRMRGHLDGKSAAA